VTSARDLNPTRWDHGRIVAHSAPRTSQRAWDVTRSSHLSNTEDKEEGDGDLVKAMDAWAILGNVTHEELRALVPAYAAGLLSVPQTDALQMHLAAGCAECLGNLYSHPVGLPSAPAEDRLAPERPYPSRVVRAVVGLLVGLLVVEAGVSLVLGKRDEAAHRVFLHAVEAERAELKDRNTILERKLSAARTIAAHEAVRLQVAEESAAELQRDLADVRERIEQLTRARRVHRDHVSGEKALGDRG
jgi:hypothetical protein